ncbi:hypothetical protein DFS34DRAFT_690584 [Phlyctochytrium arcticum]|nr:hypothetical protein DFS34DRAFT_690584 [Phlyctochytrium arcticum]
MRWNYFQPLSSVQRRKTGLWIFVISGAAAGESDRIQKDHTDSTQPQRQQLLRLEQQREKASGQPLRKPSNRAMMALDPTASFRDGQQQQQQDQKTVIGEVGEG